MIAFFNKLYNLKFHLSFFFFFFFFFSIVNLLQKLVGTLGFPLLNDLNPIKISVFSCNKKNKSFL